MASWFPLAQNPLISDSVCEVWQSCAVAFHSRGLVSVSLNIPVTPQNDSRVAVGGPVWASGNTSSLEGAACAQTVPSRRMYQAACLAFPTAPVRVGSSCTPPQPPFALCSVGRPVFLFRVPSSRAGCPVQVPWLLSSALRHRVSSSLRSETSPAPGAAPGLTCRLLELPTYAEPSPEHALVCHLLCNGLRLSRLSDLGQEEFAPLIDAESSCCCNGVFLLTA